VRAKLRHSNACEPPELTAVFPLKRSSKFCASERIEQKVVAASSSVSSRSASCIRCAAALDDQKRQKNL
jgi:hypothetical protein